MDRRGLAGILGEGVGVARGTIRRALGEAVEIAAAGVDGMAVPVGVAVGTGVALSDGIGLCDGPLSRRSRRGALSGGAAALELEVAGGTGVVPALIVGAAVTLCAICGFSNRFGGASAGGVASARIFARTRSASGWFAEARSTVACAIGAPTVRGRSMARALKTGVIIAMVSPRTTDCGVCVLSMLYSR